MPSPKPGLLCGRRRCIGTLGCSSPRSLERCRRPSWRPRLRLIALLLQHPLPPPPASPTGCPSCTASALEELYVGPGPTHLRSRHGSRAEGIYSIGEVCDVNSLLVPVSFEIKHKHHPFKSMLPTKTVWKSVPESTDSVAAVTHVKQSLTFQLAGSSDSLHQSSKFPVAHIACLIKTKCVVFKPKSGIITALPPLIMHIRSGRAR